MEYKKIFLDNFSSKRLDAYELMAVHKGMSSLDLYRLNMQICNELYSLVSCIEICLRNNIHKKISEICGTKNWFHKIKLEPEHSRQLQVAEQNLDKLKSIGKILEITPDEIICELNFGFWCNLFNEPYEKSLWIPGLSRIFNHIPAIPMRKDVSLLLRRILFVRNRIAHFESLIKDKKQLWKTYLHMKEIICWFSPEICEWALSFNNFEKLYSELIKSEK